jgi:hypothetical protein
MFIALMTIFVASSCDVWMIECYKYSAPLVLGPKTLTPVTFYLHAPQVIDSDQVVEQFYFLPTDN